MANFISEFINNREMIKMINKNFDSFSDLIKNKEYDITNNKKVLEAYVSNNYFNYYDMLMLIDSNLDMDIVFSYPKCVQLLTNFFADLLNKADLTTIIYYCDKYNNIIDYLDYNSINSKLNINDEKFDNALLDISNYKNLDTIKRVIEIAKISGYVPFKNEIDMQTFFNKDSNVKQDILNQLGIISADVYNQMYKYKLGKYLNWVNNGGTLEAPRIEITDIEFDDLPNPAKYWANQSKLLGMDAIDVVMKYISQNMQIEDINGLFDSNYIPTDKFFKEYKKGFPLTLISGNTENFDISHTKRIETLYFLCNNIEAYDGVYKKILELLNQYKSGKQLSDITGFLGFFGFKNTERIDENGLTESAYKDALSIGKFNLIRELDPNYLDHYSIQELVYIKLLDKYNIFLRDTLMERCIKYNISTDDFIKNYIDKDGLNKNFFDVAKFNWLFSHPDLFNSIDDYEKYFTNPELQYIKLSQIVTEINNYKIYNNIDVYFDDNGYKNEIIKFLFDSFDWNGIIELLNNSKKDINMINILNEKEKTIIECYKGIGDTELKECYIDYMKEHIRDVTIDKVYLVKDVLDRISKTNSQDLLNMRISIANQVLATSDPMDSFLKIEKVFLKNNLPLFAKIFSCFKILYPNFEKIDGNINLFDFSDSSRISPQLKNQSLPKVGFHNSELDTRFNIIYNDLLRIALRSNSKALRDYLKNIEYGNDIFMQVLNNSININNLKNEEKRTLEIFVNHLEALLEKIIKDDTKLRLDNVSLENKIRVFGALFKPNAKYDLKDRIVRSFCHFAGINSYNQLISIMDDALKEACARGRLYEQELIRTPFSFEAGDFVRCIGDYKVFESTLENGNYSKEFLSVFTGKSDSDTTPLDIDFTMIDSKKNNIYESIAGTPTGFNFGNIFVIIKKDNPNINITRDSSGNLTNKEYDPSKIEMFGTEVYNRGYETHWGARTGLAFTDIDYLLYKENKTIDPKEPYDSNGNVNYIESDKKSNDDLSKIKFEIARNGYYIPIIDFSGNLIFTSKEYESIRKQMDGLSYYGNNSYKFSDNLNIPEIDDLFKQIELSIEDSNNKRAKINSIVDSALSTFNLVRKDIIDGDLTPGSVEFIDTGSTGRFTNIPFHADFDFILRVDQSLVTDSNRYKDFKNNLLNTFKKYSIDEIGITNNGDYRLKGVQIDSETKIDIDFSFVVKTDKISYSSDECVKDRLKTIYKEDPEKYKYVVSNIIMAKEFLKKSGVYKAARSDKNQGGLGGIGVENWILQNGGSFIDAIQSFMNYSSGKSFDEFKNSYQLWDFGKNHFASRDEKYPYDNFIDNMNKEGYEKMKAALNGYLKSLNIEKMSVK